MKHPEDTSLAATRRRADPDPATPISPRRERIQGITIVCLLGALVVYAVLFGVIAGGEDPGGGTVALLSLGLALVVVGVRAGTPWGAFWGGLCCFTLTWWTRGAGSPLLHSLLPSLVTLVVLTSVATRVGRSFKQPRGLTENRSGRAAAQILANLGAAALLASPLGAYAAVVMGRSFPVETSVLLTAALAALAEATADTLSSELGPLFAGHSRTVLITTLRRVPRGTDGGVSVWGTVTGVVGAALVVAVALPTVHMLWPPAAIALVAAVLGFLFDSVLGATLERRGWIGNDVVNLSSTTFAGLAAIALSRFQL